MNKIVSLLFSAAIPAVCFYALEGYSHLAFADITAGIQFLNLGVFYLLFILLLFILGKKQRSPWDTVNVHDGYRAD